MPNTFEEASKASEEMFVNEEQNNLNEEQSVNGVLSEEATQLNADETPTGEQGAKEEAQAVLNEATQTAETAAQVAAMKDAELQQALQQVEALKTQNSQLQGAINELSRRNEEQIIEEALEPPTLDMNALAFADEETIRQTQAKYAADMAEYSRKQIMKELTPFVEQAKEGIYEKEKKEVISSLSQIPELKGIEEMLPQIERIIANNKWLSSDDMPIDEKFINAFAMAKGVNSINTPPPVHKEPTTEELMEMYNNNPAFQEMVEKQRLETIKQSQQVPPFSASSGAVNAALDIKEKPKTFEEASRRTREMFGMR